MPEKRITAALRAQRDAAADECLAAHDFSPMEVGQSDGHWSQDEPDRWHTLVYASDPAETDAEQGKHGSFRAQFNVCFRPGAAEVEDAYEGDWERRAA